MVAYVVFTREKMRDRDEYEQYREKSRPVNAGHQLKPLALYGKHEVLEGPAIEGAVILEFPTVEAAKTYYHSPAYQEAAKHRFVGADYRVFIVEGMYRGVGAARLDGLSPSPNPNLQASLRSRGLQHVPQ